MNDIWKLAQNESGLDTLANAADLDEAVKILHTLLE